MPTSAPALDFDVVVVGGGIAGLWLANRLKQQGYAIALFEQQALGGGQTLASQGMIHGGMKYTLSGQLTQSSETIADMPGYWRQCLCGEGDIDLRNTRLLSDHFYLWSSNSVTDKFASFLASKALRGRVQSVPEHKCPPLLRHADFQGALYQLDDIVLDVHSLVTNLARPLEPLSFQLPAEAAHWHNHQGQITLEIRTPAYESVIRAQRFIFCAGEGNAALMASLGLTRPAMQRRPLQQVMIKHRHPHRFFGHCVGANTSPRLTISSHTLNAHEQVWYLGGSLAERGAAMSEEELIALAQQELNELLPWVDLGEAEWKTLPINRAEPHHPQLLRPDNAYIAPAEGANNLLVAWPTKLTLAPNLANQALQLLTEAQIQPGNHGDSAHQLRPWLTHPAIAPTPWEAAFPPAMSAEEALALRFPPNQEDH